MKTHLQSFVIVLNERPLVATLYVLKQSTSLMPLKSINPSAQLVIHFIHQQLGNCRLEHVFTPPVIYMYNYSDYVLGSKCREAACDRH